MPNRTKLPQTRESITHKVVIGGSVDIYIIVGLYKDGTPGEVFAKINSEVTPMLDQWCRAVSILLQNGHTTKDLVRWFGFAKYGPSGFTDNPEIRNAHSPTDYIVRWMDKQFSKLTKQGE